MHQVSALAATLASEIKGPADSDLFFWSQALSAQCRDIASELGRFDLPPAVDAPPGLPTFRQLAQLDVNLWPDSVMARAIEVRSAAIDRIAQVNRLAQLSGDMATMDFRFLYDVNRELLSIGYNVDERRLDTGFYDLLASEARLTNFVAIAQGQLPQESWFTLGRLLTSTGGVPVLLSWTGSMFEYLMPMLVMPSYEGTLLDQTCRAAVARQIEYGHQLGVPWGVSESGYNVLDAQLNYQYRAFGVPGLGLKRGLGDDVVIAPYATALALMVAPEAACRNLQRLATTGAGVATVCTKPSITLRHACRAARLRGGDRVVHGASPGHEPVVDGELPARATDAAPLRIRPAVQGHDPAAAGAYSEDRNRISADAGPACRRCSRADCGDQAANFHRPRPAEAFRATAVERPVSRDGQ
jgi:hypothetical protein